MTIGDRIEERRKAVGIKSQSELARRAEMRQSTLNGLIRKPYRWSPFLTRIARELQTTVEYLVGEIEDPDTDAPPPALNPIHDLVMLPVALPTEAALTRMFHGLLRPFELEREDVLARTLARQLPIGLRQLQGRLIEQPAGDLEPGAAEAPASDRPAPRRAQRT